jgi:mannose-6-phosphate isomerase-like protein (cupin superfamily)
MSDYTKVNLEADVENMAARQGAPEGVEARFARSALNMREGGVSLFRTLPNGRTPFGHKHAQQEEIYVITRGSGRIKIEDEIVDLQQWDAIRVAGPLMRAIEAGPEGIEYVAFGAPFTENKDAELDPEFWKD